MAVFRNTALGLVFGDLIYYIYPHSFSLLCQKYHQDFDIFFLCICSVSIRGVVRPSGLEVERMKEHLEMEGASNG
jgi:hypothetical protein